VNKDDRSILRHWEELSKLDMDQSIIDPLDSRGLKNKYLAEYRDKLFLEVLCPVKGKSVVMDFGCGTGSASANLLAAGFSVVGVDISSSLLSQAKSRCNSTNAIFVRIDGKTLPVATRSLDAVVSYGVLIYVVDSSTLVHILKQIRRSLKLGASIVMIEQVAKKGKLVESGLKRLRTLEEWIQSAKDAGFSVESCEVVRYGRFPLTMLVRYGLLPKRFWGVARNLEKLVAKKLGVLPAGYSDVRIVATNPFV
jgi:ubiquinone/menaquinone biosynthesis C-methylase UbiE